MQIKHFSFCSFEEWQKEDYHFHQKIGNLYCSIDQLGYENGGGYLIFYYAAVISNSENPFSSGAFTVAKRLFSWNERDVEVLKEWYYDTIKTLNQEWEKYITQAYLLEN